MVQNIVYSLFQWNIKRNFIKILLHFGKTQPRIIFEQTIINMKIY